MPGSRHDISSLSSFWVPHSKIFDVPFNATKFASSIRKGLQPLPPAYRRGRAASQLHSQTARCATYAYESANFDAHDASKLEQAPCNAERCAAFVPVLAIPIVVGMRKEVRSDERCVRA